MVKKREKKGIDRRFFTRISSILPVIISIYRIGDEVSVIKKMQGFTRNISEDGLGLEINDLDDKLSEWISDEYKYVIDIEVPYQSNIIKSTVSIAWQEKLKDGSGNRYLIGVQFLDLERYESNNLIRYAKQNRRKPYVISGLILILIFGLYFSYLSAFKAKTGLTRTKLKIKQMTIEKNKFESRLGSLNRKYYSLENRVKQYELLEKKLEKSLEEDDFKKDVKKGDKIQEKDVYELKKKLERALEGEQKAKKKAGDYLTDKWETEAKLSNLIKEKKLLMEKIDEVRISQDEMKNSLQKLESVKEWIVYKVDLKSGLNLTGELVAETETKFKLKVGKGTLSIEKDWIKNIKELSLNSELDLHEKWDIDEKSAKLRKISGKKILEGKIRGKPLHVEVKNRRIYANDKLFYVKGIGYGIEYPKISGGILSYDKFPKDIFEKDFKMMKDAGINVIRTYEPLNIELLDIAAKYDIKVIENICYPTGATDFSSILHLSVLLDKTLEVVYAHKNHKAILMWSIWNDAPWIWDASGTPFPKYLFEKVNDFLREIYLEIKKVDPNHPVTASNVLGFEGSELGFDFLDVLGFNSYLGGMDWYVEEDAIQTSLNLIKISKKYNKPVIILETGFSTYVEDLDQGEILLNQFKIIGQSLAGVCVFQWADGWAKAGDVDTLDFHIEEHWGLLTGYRKPKSGYHSISKIFNSIPDESKGYVESDR